ncbi:MAG: 50S ribosomal protein L32 [Deltaproteobacteria bacterium]|nr:50S ribosomal protein L32 [Deltaproteobacteria bacterium]
MAVPKRRHSTTRRDKRRSHDSITLPNPASCPQCGEAKMPHRVCPSCGTYKGRQVAKTEE